MSIALLALAALTAAGQEKDVPTPPDDIRPLGTLRLAVPEKTDAKRLKGWRDFVVALSKKVGVPVRLIAVDKSGVATGMLRHGRVDFAVLNPEDYVRIAAETERGATVALGDEQGRFGLQVALLVRPDSPFESETDVLFSTNAIGLLRIEGFRGRFYRGPLTDADWRIHAEFRERLVYGPTASQLLVRLAKQTGQKKLGAVMLPVSELPEPDEQGLRAGLREVWLSPLCPGRVIAGRAGLGKRERLRIGEAVQAAAAGGALKMAGIGAVRLIDDTAFEPLLEFVATPEDGDQLR